MAEGRSGRRPVFAPPTPACCRRSRSRFRGGFFAIASPARAQILVSALALVGLTPALTIIIGGIYYQAWLLEIEVISAK